MEVPLLNLRPQYKALESELKAAVLEVLESTYYIMGPKVKELEEKIASYVGAKFGVGVSSGTDALLAALMAAEVSQGDIVVTTPYSFFATAGVITRLGAKPLFVDIDPKTYNISPEKLTEFFKAQDPETLKKIKAIVPVHLYGQAADMDPIMELSKEYGIYVIEDAAQAIGTTYPGKSGLKKAGAIGDFGCFSFFPSKNLGGIGDGGMVTTNDAALAEKLRQLRNHGMHPKYYHDFVGGNFRLDEIQAAALIVKLKYLDEWHTKRQANAQFYDETLDRDKFTLPHLAYGRENHIYNQYIIRVPDNRDGLREHFNANGIGHDVYYPVPFHLQKCFADLGYTKGDFPESELAAETTIALPIFPDLTPEMLSYVANSLNKFYG